MFSSQYDWLMLTSSLNNTMDELSLLTISVNTKIVLFDKKHIRSQVGARKAIFYKYEIYKYHYSQPLVINKIQVWNKVDNSFIKMNYVSSRKNFGGIELNVSFAVSIHYKLLI